MNLLALDVRNTGLKEVPETIGELSKLMSLRVNDGTNNLLLPRFGNLTSLQELVLGKVVMPPWFTAELGKLTELRVLEISFLETGERMESVLDSLCGLRRIQNLTLRFWLEVLVSSWDGWVPPPQLSQFVTEGVCMARLPAWVNLAHVPHLSNLRLKLLAVEAQDWEVLARMAELRYLCIYSTVRLSSAGSIETLVDDGHIWNKYSQKEIPGAKYPRLVFLFFSFQSSICTCLLHTCLNYFASTLGFQCCWLL